MGSKEENQLYEDLLFFYRPEVRPVKNESEKVNVEFSASLIRIIDLDEKKQVLTINLWLEMSWKDPKLVWTPNKYNGIQKIHVGSDLIWTPDIVLYDNAAGDPQISIFNDALVYFDGTVSWKPPAIYKSFCEKQIYSDLFEDLTFEKYGMKFSPSEEIFTVLVMDILHPKSEDVQTMTELDDQGVPETVWFSMKGMDLSYYHRDATWDLVNITSARHEKIYPGCCGLDFFVDITFYIHLRRKPLFYLVNLVIPCLLIAFLTTFVFYVPPQGKKITLAVNILLTMTVFLLVLVELLPPVSLSVPLIARYLLFTMALVGVSIFMSVISLNINYRSGTTHRMPKWVKSVFIQTLPRYLCIKPYEGDDQDEKVAVTAPTKHKPGSATVSPNLHDRPKTMDLPELDITKFSHYRQPSPGFLSIAEIQKTGYGSSCENLCHPYILERMLTNVKYIANHFKKLADQGKQFDEWTYVAAVIDRIFLISFTFLNLIGSMAIVMNAPALWKTFIPLSGHLPYGPLGGDTMNYTFLKAKEEGLGPE